LVKYPRWKMCPKDLDICYYGCELSFRYNNPTPYYEHEFEFWHATPSYTIIKYGYCPKYCEKNESDLKPCDEYYEQ